MGRYRAQAHLTDDKVEVCTRTGNNWRETFLQASNAVARLKANSAILDGETVAMKGGVSDSHELRHQLGEAVPEIVYHVFDLLWLDGEELRPLPWRERKARLAWLIGQGARSCTLSSSSRRRARAC